jgi:hypothetical protein
VGDEERREILITQRRSEFIVAEYRQPVLDGPVRGDKYRPLLVTLAISSGLRLTCFFAVMLCSSSAACFGCDDPG